MTAYGILGADIGRCCHAIAVLIPMIGAAVPAAAQAPGDAEAGRRLAETWCASCHMVAPGGRGPATDATPDFAAVAAMPSTTAMSLRVFLQTPHSQMPDLHLSRPQTDDLISYILSLRGG